VEFGDDVADNESNIFTYTYTLTASNSAAIVVTFKSGKWDEYDLTFSSAAQGLFVRREYQDGVLKDTDRGGFSAVVLAPPNPPGGGGGTMPTNSVSGFTYTMDDGGAIPTTLIFSSMTAGTELDDSAPSQFTYTYTVTGVNTANLVARFKTDKWDEYDLVFTAGANSGAFVRRAFDQNLLKKTSSGSFSGTISAP
jgi:hypothetical protein